MRLLIPWLLTSAMLSVTYPLMAQEAAKQCESIAAMTGDFYFQRSEGKTKQEMQQNTPPEIRATQFYRSVDLAINLAFTFDPSLSEDQVETLVFDHCMKQHPND